MNLSGTKNRLVALTKELAVQWDETKNHWWDAKTREFERRYIAELLVNVDRTVTAIERLNEVLDKVRKDCE
ncbi:MAG: hypothetical protein ABSD77_02840 [Verrucomicrobiota bacterium]|jgi:hypothetical protein